MAGLGCLSHGSGRLRADTQNPHLRITPHIHLSHIPQVHTSPKPFTTPSPQSGLALHVCQQQPDFHPHKNSCVCRGCPVGAVLIPFRSQAGWRVAAETLLALREEVRDCSLALSLAPKRCLTIQPSIPSPGFQPAGGLLHRPGTGGQVMDRPQGAGITKELAPTTGSGSFLPQAASDWPREEVEGQARGCRR